MFTCPKCRQSFPLSERRTSSPHWCRSCWNAYMRARRAPGRLPPRDPTVFTCKDCKQTLPVVERGHGALCRPCRAARRNAEYLAAHPPVLTFVCRRCGGTFPKDQKLSGQRGRLCVPCYPEYLREWCAAHPGYGKTRYRRNPDYFRTHNARYLAKPGNAALAYARTQAWAAANPVAWKALCRKQVATRRARLLNATPKWLTREQHAEIATIYSAAVEAELVVDHIIPLRGRRVCGLHVPWNLQLLTREANRAKSNKLVETE